MRIAITGGIGEGKSTVMAYLAELGLTTASSDVFARESFVEAALQAQLANILGCTPPVEPRRLRAALEADPEVRRAVNRLMHPKVVEKILRSPAQFIEVPLLIEACLHPLFDQVWVVTCGPDEQLKRLAHRDGSETAKAMVDSQLTSFAKTPFADVVVRTNEPLETVKRFVWRTVKSAGLL